MSAQTGDVKPLSRILLVHGTWGRRSPWTMPGSNLHERLVADFPTTSVERFEWSGGNSHRAREEAAGQLELQLAGAARTVIVAHSHGGNVAQEALAGNVGLQSRTRVIAVGTPFLHFRDRRFTQDSHDQPLLQFGRVSWLLVSAALGAGLSYGIVNLGHEPASDEPGAPWVRLNGFSQFLGDITVSLAGLCALALAVVSVISLVSTALARVRSESHNDWILRSRIAQIASSHTRLDVGDVGLDEETARVIATVEDSIESVRDAAAAAAMTPEITTIRTRGDEAATALRFGTRLSSITDRTRFVVDRLPNAFALVTWLVALFLFLLIAEGGLEPELNLFIGAAFAALQGFQEPAVVSVAAATVALPAIAALTFSLVPLLEALSCGFDGVPLLTHGRVSMRPEPERPAAARMVELDDQQKRSLRHARLMNDPNSVNAIVEACREALDSLSKPEPPPYSS